MVELARALERVGGTCGSVLEELLRVTLLRDRVPALSRRDSEEKQRREEGALRKGLGV